MVLYSGLNTNTSVDLLKQNQPCELVWEGEWTQTEASPSLVQNGLIEAQIGPQNEDNLTRLIVDQTL